MIPARPEFPPRPAARPAPPRVPGAPAPRSIARPPRSRPSPRPALRSIARPPPVAALALLAPRPAQPMAHPDKLAPRLTTPAPLALPPRPTDSIQRLHLPPGPVPFRPAPATSARSRALPPGPVPLRRSHSRRLPHAIDYMCASPSAPCLPQSSHTTTPMGTCRAHRRMGSVGDPEHPPPRRAWRADVKPCPFGVSY
jgi:hypothetical protein